MSQPDTQSTDIYIYGAHYHLLPLALCALVIALIVIIPYWKIFGKAGFPRALGILMVIPLVNLILLYVLAFSQWRVLPPRAENQ
jgi:hypothetical protein